MKRWGILLLALLLMLSACDNHADEEPTIVPPVTTTTTTTTASTTTTATTATTTTTTTTTAPTTTTSSHKRDPLPAVTFTVTDPDNTRGLSVERVDFSFGVAKNGKPHSVTVNNQQRYDASGTNTLAWDNKSGDKVLYLTFDCGYEYGNLTSLMLDTLKEKQVPGAFFCTLHYLKTASEVVERMINEGHIVGNHSKSHPSDCAALSRTALTEEVLGVHNYLRTEFGYDAKYWRFPAGVHSENALELIDSVGYRSVFWSIAHTDWDPKNQPGEEKTFQTVTERLHPGAVILLHTTSPDNAAILGRFIDYARAEGYTFRSLDEYEYWK